MTVDANGQLTGGVSTASENVYGTRRKAQASDRNRYDHPDPDPAPSTQAQYTEKKRKRSRYSDAIKEDNIHKDTRNTLHDEFKDGRRILAYELHDGTRVRLDDSIYLVSEPPGEPYYLARIMEFTRHDQDSTKVDSVRVNWFYRPRDMQRYHSDSRLLFATMHSDLAPLRSIRGKCKIEHKTELADLDQYRKIPNCFYYDRLFDKFMRRQYEVIPVSQVLNVPDEVKKVLQDRWKYVVVEVNRVKELAMEHRACKRCGDWCASKDSVRCTHCRSDFHMQCVQPPLPRKPSHGFAWSCTPCSRAEARRLEAARMPDLDHPSVTCNGGTSQTSISDDEDPDLRPYGPSPNTTLTAPKVDTNGHEMANHKHWPYRYLGVHCNISDAVDPHDRIYPRSASRIGPRHQASVSDWPGRPVEYFERTKRPIKRTAKAMKGKRSDERAALERSGNENEAISYLRIPTTVPVTNSSEMIPLADRVLDPAKMLPRERPPWLIEKPSNYIARGEGKTSDRIWLPLAADDDTRITRYISRLPAIASEIFKMNESSPNFLDTALRIFSESNYNQEIALTRLAGLNRQDLAEPTFTQQEEIAFKRAVKEHGGDLAQVAEDIKTKSVAECVRHYYRWKHITQDAQPLSKSAESHQHEKVSGPGVLNASTVSADSIADSSDDSAYDIVKIRRAKRSMKCKYCNTKIASSWRRAPGAEDGPGTIIALCGRCAELWRRYAVMWEPPEELLRKLQETGSKTRKRKFEEELLKNLPDSLDSKLPDKPSPGVISPPRKPKKFKMKFKLDGVTEDRSLLCVICFLSTGSAHFECAHCRLRVHIDCVGLSRGPDSDASWCCDPCMNKMQPSAANVCTIV